MIPKEKMHSLPILKKAQQEFNFKHFIYTNKNLLSAAE